MELENDLWGCEGCGHIMPYAEIEDFFQLNEDWILMVLACEQCPECYTIELY